MELAERLAALALKVRNQREAIQTEEATKNAFIMPFISTILGYDVFNPLEVVPEFTADLGLKKGEKIDYAIMRDGEVQILIECKKSTEPLKIEHASQLFRYFAVTNARIAVLTNGETYHFTRTSMRRTAWTRSRSSCSTSRTSTRPSCPS